MPELETRHPHGWFWHPRTRTCRDGDLSQSQLLGDEARAEVFVLQVVSRVVGRRVSLEERLDIYPPPKPNVGRPFVDVRRLRETPIGILEATRREVAPSYGRSVPGYLSPEVLQDVGQTVNPINDFIETIRFVTLDEIVDGARVKRDNLGEDVHLSAPLLDAADKRLLGEQLHELQRLRGLPPEQKTDRAQADIVRTDDREG
jgi:hypothetical protein